MNKIIMCGATLLLFLSPATLAAAAPTPEKISIFSSGELRKPLLTALANAFMKANPEIEVKVNFSPIQPGRQILQEKLAAGTMEDVFLGNTGSLFQSLDPAKNLLSIEGEPWSSSIMNSFAATVAVGTKMYGAPMGSAVGGGILYNKAVYKKLKLKIPLTWKQFIANSLEIKRAGVIPILQSYKTPWTTQLLLLADQFNLQSEQPYFAAEYTSNRAKFSTTPAALAGFEHLAEIQKAGLVNPDYQTTSFNTAIKYLVSGKAAQYPMLTLAAGYIYREFPKEAENIGFFAQPGRSASSNGLTLWMPQALFIPKSSQHLVAAMKFVAFAISPAGIATINGADRPTGPYLIQGAKYAGPLTPIAQDMLPYLQDESRNAPALEFLSPIKGADLPNITMLVGSGKISALAGAKLYDEDVKKQALQLGLPGWK